MFAGVSVSGFAATYRWYARLFGRPADVFPRDGEAMWRLTTDTSVYVVDDVECAGNALLAFATDDLDGLANRLRADGLAFTRDSGGNAPVRLSVLDDDGNRLTFFRDPLRAG